MWRPTALFCAAPELIAKMFLAFNSGAAQINAVGLHIFFNKNFLLWRPTASNCAAPQSISKNMSCFLTHWAAQINAVGLHIFSKIKTKFNAEADCIDLRCPSVNEEDLPPVVFLAARPGPKRPKRPKRPNVVIRV